MRSKVLLGAPFLVFVASCFVDTTGAQPIYLNPPKYCFSDIECDDNNPCTTDVCYASASGICVYTNLADGPFAGQIAGDCLRNDCKSGNPVIEQDPADVPDDSNPCTDDLCSAGFPSWNPKANGEPCQTGNLTGICLTNQCTDCGNGLKEGAETDTDCGGGCPSRCMNGQACLQNVDCISINCSAGVCAP
jgi:hypothetical protein